MVERVGIGISVEGSKVFLGLGKGSNLIYPQRFFFLIFQQPLFGEDYP